MDEKIAFHLAHLFPTISPLSISNEVKNCGISLENVQCIIKNLINERNSIEIGNIKHHFSQLFTLLSYENGNRVDLEQCLWKMPSHLDKLYVTMLLYFGVETKFSEFAVSDLLPETSENRNRKRSPSPLPSSCVKEEKLQRFNDNFICSDEPSTSYAHQNHIHQLFELSPLVPLEEEVLIQKHQDLHGPDKLDDVVEIPNEQKPDDVVDINMEEKLQNFLKWFPLDQPSTSYAHQNQIHQPIQLPPLVPLENALNQKHQELCGPEKQDDIVEIPNEQKPDDVVEIINESKNEDIVEIVNTPKKEDTVAVSNEPKHEDVVEINNGSKNNVEAKISSLKKESKKLMRNLISIFPDISKAYLLDLMNNRSYSLHLFEEITDFLLTVDYPKSELKPQLPDPQNVEINFDEHLEELKGLFPDADPQYLSDQLLLCHNVQELEAFVNSHLEGAHYPKLQDTLKKQQLNSQILQYTTQFDVNQFLELIPNPKEYFQDPMFDIDVMERSSHYHVFTFLRGYFDLVSLACIRKIMSRQKRFFAVMKELENPKAVDRISYARKKNPDVTGCTNIPLLQLFAFYIHQRLIYETLRKKEESKLERRRQAIADNEIATCSCCFDEQVVLYETVKCSGGCVFCKDCVNKGVEIAFAENKIEFPCLMNCGASFNMTILQSVLSPKLFSSIAQRKQLEEVKAADIDGLEFCPVCQFATIPPAGDRIFKCLNPECMKETCRLCKEPAHVPLRCDEVEKDLDVQRRTYIENKMTEAMVRECWKCKIKFIKSDGCNKMTCTCGAIICYLCKQPVKDYNHFYGQGSYNKDKCPLYSNTELLHEEAAVQSGFAAKHELGNVELKVDPLQDAKQRLRKAKKAKEEVPMPQPPF